MSVLAGQQPMEIMRMTWRHQVLSSTLISSSIFSSRGINSFLIALLFRK